MSIRQAYYSNTQEPKNGVYHVYLDKDGKEIKCSEVMGIKMENITEYFPDNIYLGEVVKYSHSVKNENYRNTNFRLM